MHIHRYIILCTITVVLSLSSCQNEKRVHYFSENAEIIQSEPLRLPGTLLIDSLMGISNIELVDSFLVLISPRNERLFHIFDVYGNSKGNFGQKGQGPNDFLNCRPTGQKEIVDNEALIWINDVSSKSLKRVNLSKSIVEQHLVIDKIVSTYPMSLNAFRLNDSITVNESMTKDNYSLIEYDYINERKVSDENIYLSPNTNPFSLYKSLWRLNPKNNIIIGAMLSINQLNLWNLDTDKKKSVIIEKTYLPNQVVDEKTGLENRTFFCDIEVTKDFIFALYMDQDYNISYEEPKKMTVFVFDWNLSPITTYTLDEYILDIAVSSDQKKMYGVLEDNSVFEYSLTL